MQNFSLKAAKDYIKKELAAANAADITLVARDIAARRHEAAAGEMWIALKTEFSERKIDAEVWSRKHLGVSSRSMEHRAYLHRHWDTYVAARRPDSTDQHGLVHAIALIRHNLNVIQSKGKTFHSIPSPQRNTRENAPLSSAQASPVALNKSVTLWQADLRDALPPFTQH